MNGRLLISLLEIKKILNKLFLQIGCSNRKVNCDYKYGKYLEGYIPAKDSYVKPFLYMNFVKSGIKLGIDVQFRRNASMIYTVVPR